MLSAIETEAPNSKTLPADWIATPFRKWCRTIGISCSHGYALAAEGHLRLTKAGNRTLITRVESDRFLNSYGKAA